MTRVLLVIAILLVVLYLDRAVRRGLRRLGSQAPQGGDERVRAAPTHVVANRLISCARCGVHVPAARAVAARAADGPRRYCSEGCRSSDRPTDPRRPHPVSKDDSGADARAEDR